MKRRQFLSTTSTAAVAASAGIRTEAATPKKKPNLLIIHCDELNFRTIGCYRDTLAPEQAFMWGPIAVCDTPHIDALAKEGTLCTKFYAATPVCSPSRSSFISGQYPQNTPVTNNNVVLSDDVISFGHLLQKAGYATGYAGKWHLDGEGKPQWGPERQFGFGDNRYMFNRGHWKQFELTPEGPRVKAVDAKGNPSYSVAGADETSFATDWLADRTIDFIEEHRDEPFCYMVSIPDPHGPDTVRAPYDTMFSDDDVQKPRTYDKDAKSAPSWAKPQAKCSWKMANYHGMMKCIDDNVGKMVAALEERGLLENTIVIFTADHGDMRGEHRRQNKGVPMEASAKVPFVVRCPEHVASERQLDIALNTTDFLPTFLALMGVETAGKEEGRDLSEFFRPGATDIEHEDPTFLRSTGKPGGKEGWLAAVTPRYKLILSDKDEPWLLDLKEDPDELVNYIEVPHQQETVQKLAQALKRYARKHSDPYVDHPVTGATLKRLAAGNPA